MGIALIAVTAIAVSAILIVATQHADAFAVATDAPLRPTSPLDEAERILARRYAQAQITAEEYGRMLAILRR